MLLRTIIILLISNAFNSKRDISIYYFILANIKSVSVKHGNFNNLYLSCLEKGTSIYQSILNNIDHTAASDLFKNIIIYTLLILFLSEVYKLGRDELSDIYSLNPTLNSNHFGHSNNILDLFAVKVVICLFYICISSIIDILAGVYRAINTQFNIIKSSIINNKYVCDLIDISILCIFTMFFGIASACPLFIYVSLSILVASIWITINRSGLFLFLNKRLTPLIINSINNQNINNTRPSKEIILSVFTFRNICCTVIVIIINYYFNIGYFISWLLFSSYLGPIVIYYSIIYLYLSGFINKTTFLKWLIIFLLRILFFNITGIYLIYNTPSTPIIISCMNDENNSLLEPYTQGEIDERSFVIGGVEDRNLIRKDRTIEERRAFFDELHRNRKLSQMEAILNSNTGLKQEIISAQRHNGIRKVCLYYSIIPPQIMASLGGRGPEGLSVWDSNDPTGNSIQNILPSNTGKLVRFKVDGFDYVGIMRECKNFKNDGVIKIRASWYNYTGQNALILAGDEIQPIEKRGGFCYLRPKFYPAYNYVV